MSDFEIGFCSVDEYHAGEDDRVMEDELCVGGLYVVMFYLKQDSKAPGAAKYPSRLNDIERQDANFYKVGFTILNGDLGSELDTSSVLRDGFWQKSLLPEGITVGEVPVRQGYFKDYYQGVDEELEAMIAASVGRPKEACFSPA